MKIFITDDNAALRAVISEKLQSEQYDIKEFESGEQLLAAINEQPDLILLDIEMSGLGGLLTCRCWRASEQKATQIIFISAHDDLKTRLDAYDAGANDFLAKPLSFSELERKIQLTQQMLQQQQAINEHVHFVEQTAMAALSSLGEMGIIRQFMQAAMGARTVDELMFATMEALRQFGLTGLVKIQAGTETRYFSSATQSCNSLEMTLLDQAALAGHLVTMQNRSIINFPTVTLFASDNSNPDGALLQRTRDSLTILMEACHAWLLSFSANRDNTSYAAPLVCSLLEAINNIQNTLNINCYRMEEIHKQLLNKQLVTLEFAQLNESDKNELTASIKDTHKQLAAFLDSEKKMAVELHKVGERLHSAMQQANSPPPIENENQLC